MSRRALAILESLPRFALEGAASYQPGLERITALLELLGNPHKRYPVVHVAGTNGKGSTASFVAAAATAAGVRTGLHTSPHLVDVEERMRVDGVPADPDWLDGSIIALSDAFQSLRCSYFEATVALSLAWFAEERVDMAVVEVGLGGRLDATNILEPAVCVITRIALDHTGILGADLESVAREKAGIIKRGVPVVAADSGPSVEHVLRSAALAAAAPFHAVHQEAVLFADRDGHPVVRTPLGDYPVEPGLPGFHHLRNAAVAIRCVELLNLAGVAPSIDRAAILHGLATVVQKTGIRGRSQILGRRPLVMADVAHNPDGLAHALTVFSEAREDSNAVVAFGTMADKDAESMIKEMVRIGFRILPVRLESERALSAGAISALVEAAGGDCAAPGAISPADIPGWIGENLPEDEAMLVAGSHVLVGAFLSAWGAYAPG